MSNFIDKMSRTMPEWLFLLLFAGTISLLAGLVIALFVQAVIKIFGIRDKPAGPLSTWSFLGWLVLNATSVTGATALVKFLFNKLPPSQIADAGNRLMMCFAFLAFATVYVVLSNRAAWIKGSAGLVKIGGALASNYIQLGNYAADPKGPGAYNRLSFILGGIYVLPSGVKDLYEVFGAKKST